MNNTDQRKLRENYNPPRNVNANGRDAFVKISANTITIKAGDTSLDMKQPFRFTDLEKKKWIMMDKCYLVTDGVPAGATVKVHTVSRDGVLSQSPFISFTVNGTGRVATEPTVNGMEQVIDEGVQTLMSAVVPILYSDGVADSELTLGIAAMVTGITPTSLAADATLEIVLALTSAE